MGVLAPPTFLQCSFIKLSVARPVFMTPAACDLGCLVMPSLEDSALVHGPPPRRPWDTRPSARTAQAGTQSAPDFLSGALSFFFVCYARNFNHPAMFAEIHRRSSWRSVPAAQRQGRVRGWHTGADSRCRYRQSGRQALFYRCTRGSMIVCSRPD